MNKFSRDSVTDSDIRALRTEAGEAGDFVQVDLCDRALAGDDDEARGKCALAIDAARMAGEDSHIDELDAAHDAELEGDLA